MACRGEKTFSVGGFRGFGDGPCCCYRVTIGRCCCQTCLHWVKPLWPVTAKQHLRCSVPAVSVLVCLKKKKGFTQFTQKQCGGHLKMDCWLFICFYKVLRMFVLNQVTDICMGMTIRNTCANYEWYKSLQNHMHVNDMFILKGIQEHPVPSLLFYLCSPWFLW